MKKLLASVLLTGATLAGCSSPENDRAGQAESGEVAKAPLVAYGYTYRFTMPGAAINEAQDRHMALCDRMGAGRCRMVEMHRTTSEGSSDGSIRFLVPAGEARRFGQAIAAPVVALGGEVSSREYEAEDVTVQTADAAARVTEKNNVDNRAAAATLRERVATSTVWAYYEGSESFGSRVGAALGAGGETLTTSIVALIYFLAAALPWVVVLGALFVAARAAARTIARRVPRRPDRVVAPPAGDGPGA